MKNSRRSFLATAAAATAGLATVAKAPVAVAAETAAKSPVKFGVCSYSYWHFAKNQKVTIDTVIDKVADTGAAGLDILHRQMDLPEREPLTADHRSYLRKLKQHAFRRGVDLVCLSIHQDFVDPDPAFLQKEVDHTIKCIEIAYELGIPCIRLNSGRWNTITSFDDLMKARGVEPITPGHTEDDGFKWCRDCIQKVLPKAEECGVTLAMENHWGLTRTPEGLLRVLSESPSPWLGALMDTGNFLEDPYTKLEQIASKVIYVQAKTYQGGGEWYTLDLDY
ncbi:MAG TPA: sugar phosphate isomerase/epimerase family protein, partial [Verrucomicrobiae bacterium]|nr:sugar phosphate isomerase/epimerase family protein [Verrucomicrobiae bacterium]